MESTLFLIVLGVVLAAVLLTWTALPAHKGSRGERAVHGLLRQSLHPSEYAILRDVVLPFEGATTQIDHVVVSRFGIFVIETRHLAGWIFGSERDSHWTQSLGHFRMEFQNPLRQNQAHVRALQTLLGLRATKFHSLVVFSGKSEFRTAMPLNVLQLDRLVPFIEVRRTPLLTAEEADRALDLIESSRLEPGAATNLVHIESLRERHAARTNTNTVGPRQPWAPQDNRWRPGARALMSLASLALILLAGNVLVGGFDGLRSIGGAWPVMSSDHPFEQEAPGAPDHAELRCSYASDARGRACFDSAGAEVPLEFEACKARADETLP